MRQIRNNRVIGTPEQGQSCDDAMLLDQLASCGALIDSRQLVTSEQRDDIRTCVEAVSCSDQAKGEDRLMQVTMVDMEVTMTDQVNHASDQSISGDALANQHRLSELQASQTTVQSSHTEQASVVTNSDGACSVMAWGHQHVSESPIDLVLNKSVSTIVMQVAKDSEETSVKAVHCVDTNPIINPPSDSVYLRGRMRVSYSWLDRKSGPSPLCRLEDRVPVTHVTRVVFYL